MCEKNKKPQELNELTDDALEQASGGASIGEIDTLHCRTCQKITDHKYVNTDYCCCTVCGRPYDNKGVVG